MNCNQVHHECSIKAGRVMLVLLQSLADNGEDFAFVTTRRINRNK
jgi:hypothetical protein